MAGKAKARVFVDVNEQGIGKTTSPFTLPNGSAASLTIEGPSSFDNLLNYLRDHATDKEKSQAFTFHWRGLESMAAQKCRIANDTVVNVPGMARSVDLMEIAESNLGMAVDVINAHALQVSLLSDASKSEDTDTDDEDIDDEDTEKAKRKNRAWDNARRFLLESGKVLDKPDARGRMMLEVNPDYTAPAVKGGSDAPVENAATEEKPKRGRPRKNA